jgi:hypothetical protein
MTDTNKPRLAYALDHVTDVFAVCAIAAIVIYGGVTNPYVVGGLVSIALGKNVAKLKSGN